MKPEEEAAKLLTIDQESLDRFLKDHVDIVRTFHTWVLERTEVHDIKNINIMLQFFCKFTLQARMMIERELNAMKRPPS